jgi:Ca2+/Na+ antiporter
MKDGGALSTRTDIVTALVLGSILGVLTFAVPWLAVISTNPNVGMLQKVAYFMLLPGLLIAIATSGNVHAFYLWVAAIGNFFFYAVIVWFFWSRWRDRNRPRSQT